MPELPEVETVCRGLASKLEGRGLATVVQRRADLRFPLPPDFAARLTGRRVARIGRRGKYILVHLDDQMVWLVHLGMSGRIILGPPEATPPGPHDHVVVLTDDGTELRYTDARRFGMMDLVPAAGLADCRALAGMGPEPLEADFSPAYLSRVLAGRQMPVKAALLDQKIVAGIGNIYACESLFRARLSPLRRAHTLTGARARRLVAAVKAVLAEAIAAGGSSLRDYVQASGELGYFQHQWAVYDREGEACPGCTCDRARTGGIGRLVQSGRSTFYCPVRQR
ncbi:MAG: bifunctional DNA-formamidopyrimidine glycosylase/DNA-(apurinic or apyrimidinic site) lyase [Alphaproteobacteria bacterium]|jgi:formamidopyrimidine-DNA glycosylase|nr:bifunctional DNA-formamidopyrimidine glycosylase/DNA-(apurinic or apyrimidinic site) lyase [Alphaproteobacteria bacterium]